MKSRLASISLTVIVTTLCFAESAFGQNNKALGNAMGRIDSSFKEYIWAGYPSDDWGIGSIFNDDDTGGSDPLAVRRRLCPTYTCLNTKPSDNPNDRLRVDLLYL